MRKKKTIILKNLDNRNKFKRSFSDISCYTIKN